MQRNERDRELFRSHERKSVDGRGRSRFSSSRRTRRGAIRWSAFVFLFVFSLVLVIVAYYTLIPGMEAAKDASPEDKRRLVAWYRLLLAVLLFILFAGLAITFRFGRLFFPRPSTPRVKTQYVDAWAESAKRMEVPPEEEDER